MLILTTADPGTPEWFDVRRGGITGTDLPKILGLSKYGNALSVWLDKRGQLPPDTAGEAARWGNLLEDPVAQEWAHRFGAEVIPVGVAARDTHQWQRASLDRLLRTCPEGEVFPGCGLEVKTRSAYVASQWEEGIPDDVLAQVAWGRLVTGLDHMHVTVLLGGQRLLSFRYDRDETLENYLEEKAADLWEAVCDGVAPEVPPDGDGVLLGALGKLYATREGDVEVQESEAAGWLIKYRAAQAMETRARKNKAEAQAALVQLLRDGERAVIDGSPAYSFATTGGGHSIPAAAVRRLQKEKPELWALLTAEGFVKETAPSRRFNVHTPKETP